MSQSNSIMPGGVRQSSSAYASASRQVDGQKTLANRLADQMGLKPGSLAGKADDFSPGKVAERVLGFIGGRLESARAAGEDTGKLQTMYDQAAKGVEKGFEEARKILDGMGVLKGKVAADIDETWQRIQTGLGGIAEWLLPGTEQAAARGEGVSLSADASRLSAQAQTFDRARALDGSQLASMALNLTQTSLRQVSETYGRVSGEGTPASAANSDLRDYALGLVEALRAASEAAEPGNTLLRDLLDGGFAIDERFDQERLEKAMDLNQRMLEGLQALRPQNPSQTLPPSEPSE